MCKPSFDEVTKEELLDSIRVLSEALEHSLNYMHYESTTEYRYCKRTLLECGIIAYSETYKDLPE